MSVWRRLQLLFDYDSTLVDYLSKVIKYTVTRPARRRHTNLFI